MKSTRTALLKLVLLFLLLGVSLNLRAQGDLVRREWKIDGVTREALVHVPDQETKIAAPVVFAFHGHGGSMSNAAKMFEAHILWPEAIVVYMQGLNTPGRLTDPEGKAPGWQKWVGDQNDRDLKFFDAVLATLKRDYKVDTKRVYSTGHSNGGAFTYLLWEARGQYFAAFAPSAGLPIVGMQVGSAPKFGPKSEKNPSGILPPDGAIPRSMEGGVWVAVPKPVLHVAGEKDPLVKFEWQERAIRAVRTANRCGDGKQWDKDKRCTIYKSDVGADVVTFIHPGTHRFPSAAREIIIKFFKEQKSSSPLVYQGYNGIGLGKHIVFIADDHEYRSEEALPALARILAKHHGFKCTVLFGIDPNSGNIATGVSNIPGTEALKTADLLVIFTRFQNLPLQQMQPIVDYLNRGGPVVGLRTSTHAFNIPADSPFAKYDYQYNGADYKGGFGRQILGETWVGHYGPNHQSSTRLDIVPGKEKHPVLTGVSNMWAEIGAYNAYPIEGSEILAMAVPLTGMQPNSAEDKTKTPMPGAWVRTYQSASGKSGRVFATTYGGSGDLVNDGFRRMLVNACYWAVGLEKAIKPNSDISFVGPYRPTWHGGATRATAVTPEDLIGWDSSIWPESN